MKKLLSLSLVALLLFSANAFGQPIAENTAPDGYHSGQITLSDNSSLPAFIKDNIHKKGEIIVLVDGKKKRYQASELKSVRVGTAEYISSNYAFYEVIWQGTNITLVRKANEPENIQYVGNEPVVITSEGSVDDYFVKKTDSPLQLLSKKSVKQVLDRFCGACASMNTTPQWDIAEIRKALEACDKCK